MPKNNFKVINTFTGQESYFPSYGAWIASMDGEVNKKVENQIFKPLNTADETSGMGSVAIKPMGSPTTFLNGGKDVAAAAGKTLDQAADEYASKFDAQPKTIGGMLGLAMGRAYKSRLDKIEAAGGKEVFQSAKRQKRSEATMRTIGKAQSILGVGTYGEDKKQQRKESKAIAKEKKRFTPMSKMQTMQVDKPSFRNALGKIGNTPLINQKEVKGLPTKGKYGI